MSLIRDTRRIYERIAPFYDLLELPFEYGVYRSIRPLLFQGLSGRILDAGVGTGRNTPFYPAGSEVVGVDSSSAMRSHISGFNLALKPGHKIVQAWRATGWWPDHYSVAIYDIVKVRGGTKLKFTQIGIPPARYSGHYRGWIETYWTPMKEIFASGMIRDRTKNRVKIDREQRIKTGRFRRSISKHD
jgi:SAM-dependent methyltransferase